MLATDSRRLGRLLSSSRHPETLQLEWQVDRHTGYTATYTHFAAGRFLSEAPPGRTVELMTWVSCRF